VPAARAASPPRLGAVEIAGLVQQYTQVEGGV
jgi:hypothetical protein